MPSSTTRNNEYSGSTLAMREYLIARVVPPPRASNRPDGHVSLWLAPDRHGDLRRALEADVPNSLWSRSLLGLPRLCQAPHSRGNPTQERDRGSGPVDRQTEREREGCSWNSLTSADIPSEREAPQHKG